MTSAAGPRPTDKAIALASGEWEGEYLDAFGHRADLHMSLESSGNTVKGRFELRIVTEDAPELKSGDVQGSIEGDRIRLTLALGKSGQKAEYSAHIRDAGGFATQALVGVVDPVPDTGMGGGVWIAWRFARQG